MAPAFAVVNAVLLVTRPVRIAFAAPNRETVDAFHAAAVEAGGVDNGGPGLRPHYHSAYYADSCSTPMGTTWKLSFAAINDVPITGARRCALARAVRHMAVNGADSRPANATSTPRRRCAVALASAPQRRRNTGARWLLASAAFARSATRSGF